MFLVRDQSATNLLLFDLTRDLRRRLVILDPGVATEPAIEPTTDFGVLPRVTAVFQGAIESTPKAVSISGVQYRRSSRERTHRPNQC